MNESEIEAMLSEMLQDEDTEPKVRRVRTFDEQGVLTDNSGLILTMADGSEFQITIVQSR